MPAIETKYAVPFEIKEVAADGTFTGYGSVFDFEDAYKEIVKPGAFRKSLATWKKRGALPAMLWQHNAREPIGKYTKMKEDGTGLYVEGKLMIESIELARNAHAYMKEGVVTGLSIGFNTKKAEYDTETNVRSLLEVDLWEVSLVTFPANEAAGIVSVKSASEIKTIRQFEAMLREQGFSDREAVAIASKGFSAVAAARDSQAASEDNAGEPQSLDGLLEALKKRGAIINGLTK